MRNTTISRSFVSAVATVVVNRVAVAGMAVRSYLRGTSSHTTMGYWLEHCQADIARGWDQSGRHPQGSLKAGLKSGFLPRFGQAALVLCPAPVAVATARAYRPEAQRHS